MANERGSYVKTFGWGALVGGALVGGAALWIAVRAQKSYVAEVNLPRSRYG